MVLLLCESISVEGADPRYASWCACTKGPRENSESLRVPQCFVRGSLRFAAAMASATLASSASRKCPWHRCDASRGNTCPWMNTVRDCGYKDRNRKTFKAVTSTVSEYHPHHRGAHFPLGATLRDSSTSVVLQDSIKWAMVSTIAKTIRCRYAGPP